MLVANHLEICLSVRLFASNNHILSLTFKWKHKMTALRLHVCSQTCSSFSHQAYSQSAYDLSSSDCDRSGWKSVKVLLWTLSAHGSKFVCGFIIIYFFGQYFRDRWQIPNRQTDFEVVWNGPFYRTLSATLVGSFLAHYQTLPLTILINCRTHSVQLFLY